MPIDPEIPTYDIRVKQGETWFMPMSYTDSEGVPVDVASAQFSAEVRSRKRRQGKLLAEITCTVTNGAAGQFTASMDSAVTSAIEEPGYYDVWVTAAADGNPQRLIQGRVLLDKAVSEVTP